MIRLALEAAVDRLSGDPKPVLLLDTCDFLDVVRGVAEGTLFQARNFRALIDALARSPGSIQPVVTYLVLHEWGQNRDEAVEGLRDHLAATDRRIDRVSEACGLIKMAAPSMPTRLESLPIAEALVSPADALLNQSVVVEKDPGCVDRALTRLMNRKRPSHKKEMKDSIHWEHYLDLSRRLGSAGHAHPRIFVSANKADFWADRNTPGLHPDLEDEANAAGMRFYGRLDQALRTLGL